MSDEGWERAHELAERAGRLTYFVEELAALAVVRGEVPADFLRERLEQLAEQATSYDLVTPQDVARRAEIQRQLGEAWRERHGIPARRPGRRGTDR